MERSNVIKGVLVGLVFALLLGLAPVVRAEEPMDVAQQVLENPEEAREMLWNYLVNQAKQGDKTAAFVVLNHIYDEYKKGNTNARKVIWYLILKSRDGGDKWIYHFIVLRNLVEKAEAGDENAKKIVFVLLVRSAANGSETAKLMLGFIIGEQARQGNEKAKQLSFWLTVQAAKSGNTTAAFFLVYGIWDQARQGNEKASELLSLLLRDMARHDDGRFAKFITATAILNAARCGDQKARQLILVALADKAAKGDGVAAQALCNIMIRLARGENPDDIFKPFEQSETETPTDEGQGDDEIDEEVDTVTSDF